MRVAVNSFLRVVVVASVITLLAAVASPGSVAQAKSDRSMVVLGIDGMDPQLLQKFVNKGKMPHFAKLMSEGAFMPLETSVPPQSPVAWSNFITGMNPGGHGIYDFIHRDPNTYLPEFSTAEVGEPSKTLSIGEWILPLSGGETKLLRKGRAFWQYLDDANVPYAVYRVPANYPPAQAGDRTTSGMGTPDIVGSQGSFSFFTDNPAYQDMDISGGVIYPVTVADNQVTAELEGPPNTLRKAAPIMKAPFTVYLDKDNESAKIKVGDEVVVVGLREFSDWVTVRFPVMGPFKSLSGIARFYLRRADPYFELYVTPINIDPMEPALPISTPGGLARHIARKIGRYYTQGMAEDTKALEYGILGDHEFVEQTKIVFNERKKMLDAVLDDYDGGFLFFYVSTIDLSCHMMWSNMDSAHPGHDPSIGLADRVEELYIEADEVLGHLRSRIPADAALMVMSDHGFAPYYKKFHLNTWLYENDYLALIKPEEIGQHSLLQNVFWRRTQAYALGINGLYINLLGRENKGIIREGQQYQRLVDEIAEKLLAIRDPETGEQVVTRVYKRDETYRGDAMDRAPDMIVGYNRGYRGSDESALGELMPTSLTDNLGKWSGSHCMDHTKVPGILVSNRTVGITDPSLLDLPTTILAYFGIAKPDQMSGRVLFPGGSSAGSK